MSGRRRERATEPAAERLAARRHPCVSCKSLAAGMPLAQMAGESTEERTRCMHERLVQVQEARKHSPWPEGYLSKCFTQCTDNIMLKVFFSVNKHNRAIIRVRIDTLISVRFVTECITTTRKKMLYQNLRLQEGKQQVQMQKDSLMRIVHFHSSNQDKLCYS